MRLTISASAALCVAVLAAVATMTLLVSAPALQLPWPNGQQHRINGGNTYGCGTHGGVGYETNYYALDFVFQIGEQVAAVTAGTVVDGDTQNLGSRGNFLEIALDGAGGLKTRYLHLRLNQPWAAGISIGSHVSRGQLIAYSGNTGGVPAHLHYDMKLNGQPYKSEPMSGVTGFGWYGFSKESGIGAAGCSDSGPGCTPSTCGNIHDPSPLWTSLPPRADTTVWRPNNATWYVYGLPNVVWGQNGDRPVPGDYSGDAVAERAVWRPSNGTWYVHGGATQQWGESNDTPVPCDYTGDGRVDFAVFRVVGSITRWYVFGGVYGQQWGDIGDKPVPADYNGDGKCEIAVWRPSNGTWYVLGGATQQWGQNGDIPVPADYNCDGRAEFGVFRPANNPGWPGYLSSWYVYGGVWNLQWGEVGDIPVPEDYDGDCDDDYAVWRPSNGTWYVRDQFNRQWGQYGDFPVPADFNGN